MADPTNPFLLTYQAVWNLLFEGQNNPLAAMVRIGNRVNYGSQDREKRQFEKPNVVSADLPELRLLDEGTSLNLHANSSSTGYTQSLTIYCQTGDFRYAMYASMVNWYIMCNMGQWRTLLTATTWMGQPFIKNIKIIPVQVGESNPERNNGISGFTAIWRMQIDCMVPNNNLVWNGTP